MQTNRNHHLDRLNHAPDKSDTVLLLIDVINDLELDGGETLLAQALPMAAALSKLKARAKTAGIPAIYANDVELLMALERTHADIEPALAALRADVEQDQAELKALMDRLTSLRAEGEKSAVGSPRKLRSSNAK